MASAPDTPCALCGTLLYGGTGSRPAGQRVCRSCQREHPLHLHPRQRPEALRSKPTRAPRRSRMQECVVCAAEFTRTYPDQKTCGRECGWTLRRRSHSPRPEPAPVVVYPSTKVAIRTCGECSTCFVTTGAGPRKYCSKQCSRNVGYRKQYGRERPAQECAVCGATLALQLRAGRPNKFCGGTCAVEGKRRARARAKATARRTGRHVSETHRARARRYGVAYEPIRSREIYYRDGWVCQLCHEPVDRSCSHPDPLSASLDHIQPMSRGGGHVVGNVQLAHLACNVAKGAEWDGDAADVPLAA